MIQIDVPLSSAGAPLPHVFADEGRLLIAYIVDSPDPSFDGTNPRSVSPATESQSIAFLTADPYLACQFGPPNDSADTVCMGWGCGRIPRSKSAIPPGSPPSRRQIGFIPLTSRNCFPAIGTSS
ncbi:hypothetical protein NKI88_25025 [Mesorhizobium sp. M0317]|uniref:hypothetical protein n=1 Tax=Mesorhizobium sp. M0317 TaxID=2956935 RepID=UPI00333D2436